MDSINTVILIDTLVAIAISRQIRQWIPDVPFVGPAMTRRPGSLVGLAADER
jgi:hypothetical protein